MPDQVPSLDSLIGLEFSHYRIIEEIGSGGMGVVFRAHDQHLEREVAIKVLHPGTISDKGARKHLHKEALALSKLNHPNIATIYDFDIQRGIDFLVMEYILGVTLNEKLAGGPLPEDEVLRLGMQLSDGLAAAHERGVVHRDLKPRNLQLTSDGRVKILDFGLAKLRQPLAEGAVAETTLRTQTISGTVAYMAPEQLMGEEVDARTDIHGAGLVLYEMATGQRPFAEVQSGQLIGAILRRPPAQPRTLNPKVSPELERIIGKCLEKEPENRYQSAGELSVDLRRLGAPSAKVAVLPRRARIRWRRVALGGATVVAVLAVLVSLNVGGWRTRLSDHVPAARIESLAVLPLENLSRDPEQEYFAEGMTDALIAELSQISALRVISRTSVMRYKGTQKPLPEIARELRVDGVVEGSVQREGDWVRIRAQLIYAPRDMHLWARSYDRELRDVLALESSVARAIADEIQVKVTPQEQARLSAALQVNPEAYEDYLRGRYEWNKRTAEGLRGAIQFFQQVIAKDPRYALAYAGLADSYFSLAYSVEVQSPREAVPKARAAAAKALALDGTLAEAHAALGAIRFFHDWDWAGAENEFKHAIALNPGYATAHHWYGLYLEWMGRIPEATAELQRAQQLDPLSLIISVNVSSAYYVAHDYSRAVEQLRNTIELDPDFWLAYWNLGAVLIALKQYPEAIADLRKAVELSGGNTGALAALGYGYAAAGERSKAEQVLQELTNLSKRRYVSPAHMAYVEIGLGNNDQAFAWLEKAYQERLGFLVELKVDPLLDRLRPDPRFRDLLRRLNLSE